MVDVDVDVDVDVVKTVPSPAHALPVPTLPLLCPCQHTKFSLLPLPPYLPFPHPNSVNIPVPRGLLARRGFFLGGRTKPTRMGEGESSEGFSQLRRTLRNRGVGLALMWILAPPPPSPLDPL